ncbi:MAG TPA: hypothetical protein VHS96_10615, partial [Bacteroidia bacterium]|nr:hypothetical protein [Bacteroidia bacterium]
MIRWICLCLFVLLATSCGGNYSNQSDRNDTHRSVVDSIPEFGSDTSKTKIAHFDTLILEKMGCRVELFTEYLFDTIGDSVLMVQDHFPPV